VPNGREKKGCQIEIKNCRQSQLKNSKTQQKFAELLEMVGSLPQR